MEKGGRAYSEVRRLTPRALADAAALSGLTSACATTLALGPQLFSPNRALSTTLSATLPTTLTTTLSTTLSANCIRVP